MKTMRSEIGSEWGYPQQTHNLSTGFQQELIVWPFRKQPIADVQTLRAAIQELNSTVARLREDHDDLKERFVSLRGRVYAAGVHKVGLKDPSQPMTRDDLRRQMGFVPGRPMKHED